MIRKRLRVSPGSWLPIVASVFALITAAAFAVYWRVTMEQTRYVIRVNNPQADIDGKAIEDMAFYGWCLMLGGIVLMAVFLWFAAKKALGLMAIPALLYAAGAILQDIKAITGNGLSTESWVILGCIIIVSWLFIMVSTNLIRAKEPLIVVSFLAIAAIVVLTFLQRSPFIIADENFTAKNCLDMSRLIQIAGYFLTIMIFAISLDNAFTAEIEGVADKDGKKSADDAGSKSGKKAGAGDAKEPKSDGKTVNWALLRPTEETAKKAEAEDAAEEVAEVVTEAAAAESDLPESVDEANRRIAEMTANGPTFEEEMNLVGEFGQRKDNEPKLNEMAAMAAEPGVEVIQYSAPAEDTPAEEKTLAQLLAERGLLNRTEDPIAQVDARKASEGYAYATASQFDNTVEEKAEEVAETVNEAAETVVESAAEETAETVAEAAEAVTEVEETVAEATETASEAVTETAEKIAEASAADVIAESAEDVAATAAAAATVAGAAAAAKTAAAAETAEDIIEESAEKAATAFSNKSSRKSIYQEMEEETSAEEDKDESSTAFSAKGKSGRAREAAEKIAADDPVLTVPVTPVSGSRLQKVLKEEVITDRDQKLMYRRKVSVFAVIGMCLSVAALVVGVLTTFDIVKIDQLKDEKTCLMLLGLGLVMFLVFGTKLTYKDYYTKTVVNERKVVHEESNWEEYVAHRLEEDEKNIATLAQNYMRMTEMYGRLLETTAELTNNIKALSMTQQAGIAMTDDAFAPAKEAPAEEEASAPVEETAEEAFAPVEEAVEEVFAPVEEAMAEEPVAEEPFFAEEPERFAPEQTEDIFAAAAVEEPVAEAVEEVAETAEEAVEETFAPVEEAAEEVAEAVEEPVAEAVEEVAETVEEAFAPVEEVAEEVTETAEEVAETVEEKFAPVEETVEETVEEVAETVEEAAAETTEAATEAVENVAEEATEVAEAVTEEAAEAVEEAVEKVEEVVEEAAPAEEPTAEPESANAGILAALLAGKFKKPAQEEPKTETEPEPVKETPVSEAPAEEAAEAPAEEAQEEPKPTGSYNDFLISTLFGRKKEKPVAETVEETKEEIAETVEETKEEIAEAVEEPVAEAVEEVTEAAEEVTEAVEETAAEAVEEVADTVEEVAETAEETFAPVEETVEDAATEASKEVAEAVEGIFESTEEQIPDYIAAPQGSTSESVKAVTDSIQEPTWRIPSPVFGAFGYGATLAEEEEPNDNGDTMKLQFSTASIEEPLFNDVPMQNVYTQQSDYGEQPAVEQPEEAESMWKPVAEEAPIEEATIAEEPVAEEPVAEEPVAEEPAFAEEPLAEEPAFSEEPAFEEPAFEEPVFEATPIEEPIAEEPVAEEPIAGEPVAEEPAAAEPAKEAVPEWKPAEEKKAPFYRPSIYGSEALEDAVNEESMPQVPVVQPPREEAPKQDDGIIEGFVMPTFRGFTYSDDYEPTEKNDTEEQMYNGSYKMKSFLSRKTAQSEAMQQYLYDSDDDDDFNIEPDGTAEASLYHGAEIPDQVVVDDEAEDMFAEPELPMTEADFAEPELPEAELDSWNDEPVAETPTWERPTWNPTMSEEPVVAAPVIPETPKPYNPYETLEAPKPFDPNEEMEPPKPYNPYAMPKRPEMSKPPVEAPKEVKKPSSIPTMITDLDFLDDEPGAAAEAPAPEEPEMDERTKVENRRRMLQEKLEQIRKKNQETQFDDLSDLDDEGVFFNKK